MAEKRQKTEDIKPDDVITELTKAINDSIDHKGSYIMNIMALFVSFCDKDAVETTSDIGDGNLTQRTSHFIFKNVEYEMVVCYGKYGLKYDACLVGAHTFVMFFNGKNYKNGRISDFGNDTKDNLLLYKAFCNMFTYEHKIDELRHFDVMKTFNLIQ